MQTNTYQFTRPLPVTLNIRGIERFTLTSVLISLDMIMVLFGFLLAYVFRFEALLSGLFYRHEVPPLNFYQGLMYFLVPLWIAVFATFGLYNPKNLFNGMREYTRVFNACTLGIVLIIFFTFFDPDITIARGWVILSWLGVTISVETARFLVRRIVQFLRSAKGIFVTNVLIVGANEEGQAIAQQLHDNPKAGIAVVGFVDDTPRANKELPAGIPLLGGLDCLQDLTTKYGIQEIIVASTALTREKLLDLFQTFGHENVVLQLSSGVYELLTTGVEVREVGNVPLLTVNKVRLAGMDVVLKWLLDKIIAGLAIALGLPLMALIALAVSLDSPGPIFYRRRVIGVGGKLFDAFKFRTMHIDADARLARDPELRRQFEQNYKLKNDPRVTRIGSILRRFSLDELPQLFNVVLGQMSLVGPRMITEPERARYGKWGMNLSTVKPGLTGLWQVSGRSDVGYDERVKLDMHYIRNYSIWFDLYLLYQTIPAVLKKRGAY